MPNRPNIDDALESAREHCEYALCLAAEAYQTPDGEDDDGKMDPIFAYAESVLKDTVPLAIIGLFAIMSRAAILGDN